jgi:hypothetical protein
MTRGKGICIALAVAALSVFSAWAQNAPVAAEKNGISVSVLIKGDTAEITVSAEVRGWVAVGFNPTNKMKDADILIGYVKNGVAYARDDFGTGTGSHAEDEKIGGKNSIISFSGTESGGRTTMTFVVPRDSGDHKDSKLLPGKHVVILAASNSDSFTGFHSKVGKTEIILP